MPDMKQFKLPDVGEGLTEAEIISWKVQPGDAVKINDIIVEIETAKSLVELPSPYAGVISELMVGEGETVAVGTAIIAVDVAPGAGAPGEGGAGAGGASASRTDLPAGVAPPAAQRPAGTGYGDVVGAATTPHEDLVPQVSRPAEGEPVEPGLIGGPAPGGRTSVLVGYGPRETSAKRRPRKGTAGAAAGAAPPAPAPGAGVVTGARGVAPTLASTEGIAPATPESTGPSIEASAAAAVRTTPAAAAGSAPPALPGAGAGARVTVLAKPPVRKLAKDLGIDLTTVAASGPGGIVTRADVEAAAGATTAGAPAPEAMPSTAGAPAMVDAGARETRIPVKGVRKMTAQAMVTSAFTAPHVTEFVTVDVTRTVKLVERLRTHRDFRDARLSPLLILAKAMVIALRRTPDLNASWDESTQEIVQKRYVNLGIAAATPRGLVVPNIKDADAMSLRQLADALAQLVSTAREGRTPPADMQQGTITITNVGVFGIDTGTPIINPGEAAILAFGAIREQPWVVRGKVRPRMVTTLAVSFDHRVADGEQGSRFLADVAAILEDPSMALALG